MDALQELQDKIDFLIKIAQSLKEENGKLVEEKALLMGRLNTLENSLIEEDRDKERLHQEKKLTQTVLDDLINRIDSLVNNEKQQC